MLAYGVGRGPNMAERKHLSETTPRATDASRFTHPPRAPPAPGLPLVTGLAAVIAPTCPHSRSKSRVHCTPVMPPSARQPGIVA